MKTDVTEPSSSPWASLMEVVWENNDSYWFCIDYSKLNDLTIKASYPLPHIDDTLDALAGARSCWCALAGGP